MVGLQTWSLPVHQVLPAVCVGISLEFHSAHTMHVPNPYYILIPCGGFVHTVLTLESEKKSVL